MRFRVQTIIAAGALSLAVAPQGFAQTAIARLGTVLRNTGGIQRQVFNAPGGLRASLVLSRIEASLDVLPPLVPFQAAITLICENPQTGATTQAGTQTQGTSSSISVSCDATTGFSRAVRAAYVVLPR